ncbi:MAG TPA: hypothetical protein VG106_13875, partial [Vicinamibacterales bacterium]|nr:hypothetical protein [Vicinamibacterales bacterium]
MRNRISRAASALALLAVAGAASAQTAPPTLQTVSPTGAQRGTSVRVTLEGTNIGDPRRIIFSEPGLNAKILSVKEVPIEKPMTPKGVVRTDAPIDDKARKYEVAALVTIPAGVPHGVHSFRLETPLGVSNLLRFAVSSLPEIAEREPNGSAAAQKVTLPAALVGSFAKPGDVDAYEFRARAGEELVFQVVARPLGSRLDSIVRLTGADGQVVAENNDFDLSRDSVLTFRVKEAGTYSLAIEDVEHGGAANGFGYRIYAGALPYVASVFPLGVPRGGSAPVVVTGVNLGSAREVRVKGTSASLSDRMLPLELTTPAGPPLNRKALVLGAYPEALEAEPNGDSAVAQRITIPAIINGRIWTSVP